jgi:hypothetical protein
MNLLQSGGFLLFTAHVAVRSKIGGIVILPGIYQITGKESTRLTIIPSYNYQFIDKESNGGTVIPPEITTS